MKFALFFLGLALVSIAQQVNDLICGLSGEGVATLQITGRDPSQLLAKMVRVGDFVRYDLSAGAVPIASIISRPDLGKTYFFMTGFGCMEKTSSIQRSCYQKDSPKRDETVSYQCPMGGDGDQFGMTFVDSVLKSEILTVHTEFGGAPVEISATITYTSVNPEYVHENFDAVFSLSHEDCPAAAISAPAITSTQCEYHNKPMPGLVCSMSASGSGQVVMGKNTFGGLVEMIRVGSYVKYEVKDPTGQSTLGTILGRPDQDETVYYFTGNPCMLGESMMLYYYEYAGTNEEGFDVFYGYETDNYYRMYVSGEFIKKEEIFLETDNFGLIQATLDYTTIMTVDHEVNDNTFVFPSGVQNCENRATDPISDDAEYKTSQICPKYLKPELPCAFEAVIEFNQPKSRETGEKVDVKVMMQGDDVAYYRFDTVEETRGDAEPDSRVMRCDLGRRYSCLVVSHEDDEGCYEGLEPQDLRFIFFPSFAYFNDPEEVSCSDPQGCLKYCVESKKRDGLENCVIVDSQGRYISLNDEDGEKSYTYLDSKPVLDDFAISFCGHSDSAPEVDPCKEPSSSSSSSSSEGSSPSGGGGGGGGDDSSSTNAGSNPSGENEADSSSVTLPSLLVLVAVVFLLF